MKGGMTNSLTRYLISLGNQAKKRGRIVMYHIFFQNETFLYSLEHQRLAKPGGILDSSLNFST